METIPMEMDVQLNAKLKKVTSAKPSLLVNKSIHAFVILKYLKLNGLTTGELYKSHSTDMWLSIKQMWLIMDVTAQWMRILKNSVNRF